MIGGGATGLGTAVEAASRGLRTLLVEKTDSAMGELCRPARGPLGEVRLLHEQRTESSRSSFDGRAKTGCAAPDYGNVPRLAAPADLFQGARARHGGRVGVGNSGVFLNYLIRF